MPKDKFILRDIQGLTPAIDSRQTEGVAFVLSGQNFVMDSKGPKAYFASRLLNGGVSIAPLQLSGMVQGIGGALITSTEIGSFSVQPDGTFTWNTQFTLPEPAATEHAWRRWTTAFVGNNQYYAHPSNGIWRADYPDWVAVDPGIGQPQAVAESNGRMIVLGGTAVAWSGPSDPEDFTPALGGAGFQILSERIAGKPYALTTTPQGYIVWTSAGGLVGEYIGGDLVFRHYPLPHGILPINDLSYTILPDGTLLMCSEQGLYLQNNFQAPTIATPVFNEFLREMFRRVPSRELRVALTYSPPEDLLFLQIRNGTADFNETFVLTLAIDKWGQFNERHRGIFNYDFRLGSVPSHVGYIDLDGVARRFLPIGYTRESTLNNFVGLDSEIVLGPLRSPQLHPTHGAEQEMQGFMLSCESRPLWSQANSVIEDDNNGSTTVVVDESMDDDGYDELDVPDDEHSIHSNLPITSFRVFSISDWSGFEPSGFLYWGSTTPDAHVAYEVEAQMTLDLGRAKYFDCAAPGIWHRIRVRAANAGEYFHITAGEFTFDFAGYMI